MLECWTDYPFTAQSFPHTGFNDTAHKMAPVRKFTLLSYDGNKYVTGYVEGHLVEIKAGYVYTERGRFGEVPAVSQAILQTIEERF